MTKEVRKETNLEHYKEELKEIFSSDYDHPLAMVVKIENRFNEFLGCQKTDNKCFTDDILDWMAQPYEAPILDSVEKRYLKSVIKPFKDKITFICKCELKENRCYIRIIVSSAVLPSGLDSIYFPIFIGDTMYKGMKANKCYSLEELGL